MLSYVPKVGTTAIKVALGDKLKLISAHEANNTAAWKVGIVRHPVLRFWSLWRNKVRDGGKGPDNFGLPSRLWGMTPTDFLSYIEANPTENTHWMPQRCVVQHALQWVRLENLAKLWAEMELPGRLTVHNSSPFIFNEQHGKLDDTILRMYAQDYDIFLRTH